MDNLPELRDIHLPTDSVSIFPLAKGWWLLILSFVALISLYYIIKFIRRTSARIYAYQLLKPLKDRSDLSAVIKMSEILRRICVRKYPQAISLSGKEWIVFLNDKCKKKLPPKAAILLQNAPFMKDSQQQNPSEVNEVWTFCRLWIGENL